MGIILFLVSGIAVLLSAAMFEAGFRALSAKSTNAPAKALAARVWWTFMALAAVSVSPASALLQLPLLAVVGLSHISLCNLKDEVITLEEIVGNVPTALREAAARIRVLLK